jgi:hypothetical protein
MSLLHEPGDLARTPLAAILLEALRTRATGVLEVAHGGGTSRLWFREGRPVGAQVFTGFRPLGMMLLQSGRIDIDALSKSLARMAETRRPQGEILVEMGAGWAASLALAWSKRLRASSACWAVWVALGSSCSRSSATVTWSNVAPSMR